MHLLANNRKINFNYKVLDTIEVGIVLKGCEIKSVSKSEVKIEDSFAIINGNCEIFLLNMYIAPFKQDSKIEKYIPDRKRKLLAHKTQILHLQHKIKKEKLTLIPTKLYVVHDKVKIELGIAKHFNRVDKREYLKKKDEKKISLKNTII
ncbi:MAG: SsrA-binding protein SmpB [Mycoplasmataceae bacterium]|jgi:SsrA-binding protein|nr:SsrA-binding protein SmpB [Mycoplasmataceae bacterium]